MKVEMDSSRRRRVAAAAQRKIIDRDMKGCQLHTI